MGPYSAAHPQYLFQPEIRTYPTRYDPKCELATHESCRNLYFTSFEIKMQAPPS